jgi:hypothetical protein
MAEHAYKPSEAVPVSGVYRVEHRGHRETHDAILRAGEVFPACSVCDLKQRAKSDSDGKNFAGCK